MAYKLQVLAQNISVNFNCKYENMARAQKPEIVAKAPNGAVCKYGSMYKGTIVKKGDISKVWMDEDGNVYEKPQLKFYLDDQEVSENQQTKVFEITNYEPLSNYTDMYVIDKFYEIQASNNDKESDYDRDIAIKVNLSGMRKLWEYLNNNGQVARGELLSARGFIASDAYIRAVSIEGKWGLEIGIFQQKKVFEHLNEETSFKIEEAKTKKKVRLI